MLVLVPLEEMRAPMRVMSALLVLATLQIAACAESGPDPSEELLETEEQRVLAAEDEYVAAEIAGDEATLRRLVDERFVLNGGDGTTSDKEALIRGVLAMDMTGQTLTDRSVLVDGALAVIFGTAELQLRDPGGQERVSKFRYTSVYVKRRDQWRMLALQMAPR